MMSFSELAASISRSTALRARDSSILRELQLGNSRSSFDVPFGRWFFADASPRRDNSELSCFENTQVWSVIDIRLVCRIDFFSLLLLKSKVKALIAMVLPSHYSQFLLFSESPMISPNFLNHRVIHQNLVEHVDDQERFQEYSCSLVCFAAFQLRGQAFLNSR